MFANCGDTAFENGRASPCCQRDRRPALTGAVVVAV
jgi:hypothetical protein